MDISEVLVVHKVEDMLQVADHSLLLAWEIPVGPSFYPVHYQNRFEKA
jgi:hypothetical protein